MLPEALNRHDSVNKVVIAMKDILYLTLGGFALHPEVNTGGVHFFIDAPRLTKLFIDLEAGGYPPVSFKGVDKTKAIPKAKKYMTEMIKSTSASSNLRTSSATVRAAEDGSLTVPCYTAFGRVHPITPRSPRWRPSRSCGRQDELHAIGRTSHRTASNRRHVKDGLSVVNTRVTHV